MILFIILVFFIFIILLPIPIKVIAHYSNENYYLKLYRINLYSKTDGIIRKILNRKSNSSNKKKKEGKNNNPKTENKEKKKKSFSIKKTYTLLQTNKFKPSIRFSLLGSYSFDDAAFTATLYGLLSNLNFILLKIFSDFFKVKKFNYSLNPNFKNELNINLTINCIITFNIAQIIYILFLMRKKGGVPIVLGQSYGK
ncbi:MAG: DUF2953 domain-containing protein [Clostridium sp.]|nr:DUF2953 domain-containing protein [Clostridium sp.]